MQTWVIIRQTFCLTKGDDMTVVLFKNTDLHTPTKRGGSLEVKRHLLVDPRGGLTDVNNNSTEVKLS